MSYRENYVENWEGKTGQQVSELIQTALGEHGAALNAINNDLDDKIEKIQFNTTKESGKVFYQYNVDSYDNSKEADGVFELKAVSNNHGQIILGNYEELYTNNTIIKYGTPFSFTVYYDILNANNQRLIGPATIKVSVNGKELNKQGLSFTTTRTGTSASKIVTLLPEELPEGTCEIRVDVDCTYGGATVFADDTPTFKINVLNPVLTVTFDDENGINKMRSMSDKFNLHFTVKNSKGQAILINNQPVVPTYDLYYGTSKTLTVSTPDNELSFNDIKGNGLSEIQGRQRIYIQAKIGQGSNIVTSNIVLLYMFCNNYISNSTLYATQLNNVQAVVSGDPTITVNQYDNTEFVVYAYSESAKQLAYTLTENNIQKTLSENYPLQADTIQDISYSIIFKSATNQSFRISDGAASDLGIQVLVNSIGTSLNELTSQVINLSANGKQSTDRIWSSNNYSVIFDSGFDWSGNGWINNGLLINNGATATIPYCPFSTGVFTASFRFFASNSISTEKLIECKSGNTEFSITPEKASFIINGSGISTEFDNSETREITFVRYAATYGNLIAIFVDGSMQCVKAVTDNASSVDANIIITASETELYLYNVNIFSQALSFTNVQSVFCFNKSNAADIIEYVKENNVFNAGASLTSIGNHGQDITPESLWRTRRPAISTEGSEL